MQIKPNTKTENMFSLKYLFTKVEFCDESFDALRLLKFTMNISCNPKLTNIKWN